MKSYIHSKIGGTDYTVMIDGKPCGTYFTYGEAEDALLARCRMSSFSGMPNNVAPITGMTQIYEDPWPQTEPEEGQATYTAEEAIRLAQLIRAGKMVGVDESALIDALLSEVERLILVNG